MPWIRRLLVVAAIAGAALFLTLTRFDPDPIPVRVAAVSRGRVEATVTNSRAGTVKARRRAKLSPEIGGRVAALPHPKGERVRRGQTLLQIDDALQRARLGVAEGELATAAAQKEQACLAAERAERELARTRRLAQDGIVSTDLLDGVESAARTAQAGCHAATAAVGRTRSAVDLARTELDKTVLRAPFDGIVAEVSIEVGEWISPSPPALPIPAVIDFLDTSSIYVSAPMDEVDSARIRAGQRARITVDSHPGHSFVGKVARVARYVLDVQAQNRTVEIDVELDEPTAGEALLPGTSADAEVVLDAHEGVLRIPTSALMQGGKVLVANDRHLVERTVVAGIKNWDATEVKSGLAEGEQVVVSLDRSEVKAGARIRVEEGAAR